MGLFAFRREFVKNAQAQKTPAKPKHLIRNKPSFGKPFHYGKQESQQPQPGDQKPKNKSVAAPRPKPTPAPAAPPKPVAASPEELPPAPKKRGRPKKTEAAD